MLDTLPPELVIEVGKWIGDAAALARCAATCRFLRLWLCDDALWRRLLKRDYSVIAVAHDDDDEERNDGAYREYARLAASSGHVYVRHFDQHGAEDRGVLAHRWSPLGQGLTRAVFITAATDACIYITERGRPFAIGDPGRHGQLGHGRHWQAADMVPTGGGGLDDEAAAAPPVRRRVGLVMAAPPAMRRRVGLMADDGRLPPLPRWDEWEDMWDWEDEQLGEDIPFDDEVDWDEDELLGEDVELAEEEELALERFARNAARVEPRRRVIGLAMPNVRRRAVPHWRRRPAVRARAARPVDPAVAEAFGRGDACAISGSAGTFHTLVVWRDGRVMAAGLDGDGQVSGVASAFGPSLVPGSRPRAVAVAAGEHHSVVVDARGAVWTFGRNDRWQLGSADAATDGSVPVRELSDVDAVGCAAGDAHTLVLGRDGSVWACGSDALGQAMLGTGTGANAMQPVAAPALRRSPGAGVFAGDNHSVVMCRNGALVVGGANASGRALGGAACSAVWRPRLAGAWGPNVGVGEKRARAVACGPAVTVVVADDAAHTLCWMSGEPVAGMPVVQGAGSTGVDTAGRGVRHVAVSRDAVFVVV